MITVTHEAQVKVKELLQKEKSAQHTMFRILVSSGGCSGFQYQFIFDHHVKSDDHIFHWEGMDVIVDQSSLDLIDGCMLDYVEDLVAARFTIKNPHATASCGCGNSFTI